LSPQYPAKDSVNSIMSLATIQNQSGEMKYKIDTKRKLTSIISESPGMAVKLPPTAFRV
jgi:hypothetical protein